MIIEIDNVGCRVITGGKDNLLGVDLMKELKEYLRVRPKGYQHNPSYRRHRWDGWKPFITPTGYFATGFLPLVVPFCEELGAVVKLEDKRTRFVHVDIKGFDDNVRHWKMMPHQVDAAKKLDNTFRDLPFARGLLYCATNAGKNTMAAGIHKNLVTSDGKQPRTLFVVHTKEIYDQAVDFFQGAGINTGGIRSGSYDTGGELTVGMVRTMANLIANKDMTFLRDLNTYDTVFIDEGHHAGAEGYTKLMKSCKSASMRIVMSGTALENEDKVKNMIIIGVAGNVLARIKNQEMFDAGVSLKPCVRVVLSPKQQDKILDFAGERAYLIYECEERMAAIVKEMRAGGTKRTVVTFEEIAHGLFMHSYLEIAFPELVVECTHGQDPQRTQKMRDFKEKSIDILVVSMIMQEGINMPGIQRMVFAHGGKSAIRNKQLSGRGMRKDKDDEATTFDIIEVWDRGLYTEKHSRKRMSLYVKEGFEIEYLYKNRRGTPLEK